MRDASEEVSDERVAEWASEEIRTHAGVGMDLVGVVIVELCVHVVSRIARTIGRHDCGTHKVFHGRLACLVDAFHKLKDVVGVTVDNGHADVVVVLVLEHVQVSSGLEEARQFDAPNTSSHG